MTATIQRSQIQTQTHATVVEACDLCGSTSFRYLFSKASAQGRSFDICQCHQCDLVQTLPRPTDEELEACYGAHYFEKRTERGYDNYYSDRMRLQLESVWEMNLRDVAFMEFERSLPRGARSLDVGCASGFFVDFMRRRGWEAEGIELSQSAARFGREELNLPIHVGDFLNFEPTEKYELITLWASIEHLRSPRKALQKIQSMLKPGGRLILSTCRWGLLSRIQKARWRFLNVPEHLFYFSLRTMENMAGAVGLEAQERITYGSGFTSHKKMGFLYRWTKKWADRAVKKWNQGDMIVYSFQREH